MLFEQSPRIENDNLSTTLPLIPRCDRGILTFGVDDNPGTGITTQAEQIRDNQIRAFATPCTGNAQNVAFVLEDEPATDINPWALPVGI